MISHNPNRLLENVCILLSITGQSGKRVRKPAVVQDMGSLQMRGCKHILRLITESRDYSCFLLVDIAWVFQKLPWVYAQSNQFATSNTKII